MAFLGGLLGGGDGADPLDIYGDLFTDKQKAALKQKELSQGLFRMSEALAKAAQPSPYKPGIGTLGATLGSAASAFGGGGDEAMNKQLQAMQIAEKVRQSRQERAILAKAAPYVEAITAKLMQNGVPAAQAAQLAPQIANQIGAPSANAPPGSLSPTSSQVPSSSTPGDLGPTNEELGAPPLAAAPGGTTTGLPARIGMKGTGPNAVMIDQDTGQPIQSSPGGPITPRPDLGPNIVSQPGQGPYVQPYQPPPAGQKQSGLLPPPDQVVGPDGQPLIGQGVLPRMLASLTGGTPGGPLPFRLASSTPTESAAPGADGLDVVLPSGPRLQRSDLMNVAAPAPGDRSDAAWEYYKPIIKKYESGNRNIEQNVVPRGGGYNPSTGTVTPWSSASSPLQMLDSTFRGGAKLAGIDVSKYPRAMNAPEAIQDEVGKALFKARGLADWAPYNANLARAVGYTGPTARGGGQDTVIPSGRGIPASALTNVADTGAPAAGGTIPGLGVTPEALAALNAMLKMGGMKSDPFGSLLETYYKSPGYLGEAETARSTAQKKVELQYGPDIKKAETIAELEAQIKLKPQLEAAIAWAKIDPTLEETQRKAVIERESKRLEILQNAMTSSREVVVTPPGGTARKLTLTNEQILRLNQGKGLPELDLPPMSGIQLGEPVLSPEETARQTQRGKTAEEMREVEVWTPAGNVTQMMTNQEIETRRKLAAARGGGGGAPQVGDIVDKPVMRPQDQKIADALGEDFVTLRRQAVAADKTIRDTHNLRSKLDSGMFTGLDANINLFLARLGDTMGWKNLSDPEKIKNTQTYIAGLGSEVLSMVKDLKPASNTDLTFAQSMVGGQNLSAASIRQLLDMREEYARLAIQRHNEEAVGRNPAIFQGARRELPMPPAYQPKELITPSGNRATINR
jgi:hypothetical protein